MKKINNNNLNLIGIPGSQNAHPVPRVYGLCLMSIYSSVYQLYKYIMESIANEDPYFLL